MKKYIKPSIEIISVQLESHILGVSDLNNEVSEEEWLAPEYKENKDRNVNLWNEQW